MQLNVEARPYGQMAALRVVTIQPKTGTAGAWALLDTDSREDKQFVTYLHYWEALADVIEQRYGTSPAATIRSELESSDPSISRRFRSLTSRQFAGDVDRLRALLLNSWSSELALYLVDDDDPRIIPQNQWSSVYTYYAAGRAALAWLLARDSAIPQSHRSLLDALAAEASARTSLLLPPWNLTCIGCEELRFGGFMTTPSDANNLRLGENPYDLTAKFLKTTRRNRLQERVKQRHPKRAPNGYRAEADSSMPPTTVFDYMWRSRTRANYGDPAMFYVGTISQHRARRYLHAIRTVNHATMAMFEILVSQRARPVLASAAEHFIDRDRTSITDRTIGLRLSESKIL